ncbi:MAG: SWF/SNF helicase family protein, partial [Nitrospirae bacterium]|nr:SWF/SNF helicase family protein [Nitrospirota bacterium]
QRLMIGLNCMRMVSDSTYILDQKTRHDTKIDELMTLLQEIFENREKVVIFSQWERMTRLVANELDALKVGYQYLHGGVPSARRKDLLTNFREDKDCLVFLSTDAGGVGLNLQSASILVNLDIPWNPAVLEQRIGRIHRLGQHKPVNVINFISRGTIEENLLGLLSFKKSVFEGVLDNGENIVFMGEGKLKQFMNSVAKMVEPVEQTQEPLSAEAPLSAPPLPTDSNKPAPPETQDLNDLFKTGISFLEKLSHAVSEGDSPQPVISSFIEKDKDTGKSYFKIPVPDEDAISKAVSAFGRLLQGLRK